MRTKYNSTSIEHIPENYQDLLLIVKILETIREFNDPKDYGELYWINSKRNFEVDEEQLLEYDTCHMEEVESFTTYYAKY